MSNCEKIYCVLLYQCNFVQKVSILKAFKTQKVHNFFGEVKLKGGWTNLETRSIEYV